MRGTVSSPIIQRAPVEPGWPAEREEITFRVKRSTQSQPWFRPTLDVVLSLLELPADWNGYGEKQIHAAAAKRLVALLDGLDYAGPPPRVAPVRTGDLQLEWHSGDRSIEVMVPSEGPAAAFQYEGDDDASWEVPGPGPTSLGLQRLREALDALPI